MRRRVLLRIADAWIWLRAKYHTWLLFRAQPWRQHKAKRRTP